MKEKCGERGVNKTQFGEKWAKIIVEFNNSIIYWEHFHDNTDAYGYEYNRRKECGCKYVIVKCAKRIREELNMSVEDIKETAQNYLRHSYNVRDLNKILERNLKMEE